MKYILFLILGITITVICLRKPTIEGASKKKKKKKKKEELQATAAESGITWEDQSLVDMKILAGIMNEGQANDEYS